MIKFFLSFLRKQESTAPGRRGIGPKRIPDFAGITLFLPEPSQKI
ncbi:Uncharacterized protein dnm_077990 [Desulfonema magnum]|uniref:Uncharacterized protein n=1 Tax=Desulfonema magnum TaxID=45655 RepID=A0A975GS62_9BACT|nr:Uncharacterized protein dnm_077990 [Desulfonema magnum]